MADLIFPNDPGDELDWVQRLAQRLLRDEDLAGDISQEAFMISMRRRDIPQGERAAWLSGVVRNLARSERRKNRSRQSNEARHLSASVERSVEAAGFSQSYGGWAAASHGGPVDGAAELPLVRAEEAEKLQNAVMGLPEPFRTVVRLRYFDDLAPTAIAARTGRSVGTIKTQLHRGIAKLRDSLDASADGERERWVLALVPLLPKQTARSAAFGGTKALVFSILALLLTTVWIERNAGVPEAAAGSSTDRGPSMNISVASGALDESQSQRVGASSGREAAGGQDASGRLPAASAPAVAPTALVIDAHSGRPIPGALVRWTALMPDPQLAAKENGSPGEGAELVAGFLVPLGDELEAEVAAQLGEQPDDAADYFVTDGIPVVELGLDGQPGKPLTGEGRTDKSGKFRLPAIEGGTCDLVVEADGYSSLHKIHPLEGSPGPWVMALNKPTQLRILRGNIPSAEPIAIAILSGQRTEFIPGTIAPGEEALTLDHLRMGKYTLSARSLPSPGASARTPRAVHEVRYLEVHLRPGETETLELVGAQVYPLKIHLAGDHGPETAFVLRVEQTHGRAQRSLEVPFSRGQAAVDVPFDARFPGPLNLSVKLGSRVIEELSPVRIALSGEDSGAQPRQSQPRQTEQSQALSIALPQGKLEVSISEALETFGNSEADMALRLVNLTEPEAPPVDVDLRAHERSEEFTLHHLREGHYELWWACGLSLWRTSTQVGAGVSAARLEAHPDAQGTVTMTFDQDLVEAVRLESSDGVALPLPLTDFLRADFLSTSSRSLDVQLPLGRYVAVVRYEDLGVERRTFQVHGGQAQLSLAPREDRVISTLRFAGATDVTSALLTRAAPDPLFPRLGYAIEVPYGRHRAIRLTPGRYCLESAEGGKALFEVTAATRSLDLAPLFAPPELCSRTRPKSLAR